MQQGNTSVIVRNGDLACFGLLRKRRNMNIAMSCYWNGTINGNKGNRTIREKVTVVVEVFNAQKLGNKPF